MLQKIVNGIAIASGVVSLAVVGTVGYVYVRKDAIIENIKGKVMESVMPDPVVALVVLYLSLQALLLLFNHHPQCLKALVLVFLHSSGTDKTNWYSECNHSSSCTEGLVDWSTFCS